MSVKETKTIFSKVVRFINANPASADATVRQHIKSLIVMWKQKNITLSDLVRMKDHHHFINGQMDDEGERLWRCYIEASFKCRSTLRLLQLNTEH